MLGFSSVASRRNCCTARCCSIWYLLFIATLSFFLAEKSTVGLLWAASLRVATFYELPGKVIAVAMPDSFSVADYPPKSAIAYWFIDAVEHLGAHVRPMRWRVLADWVSREFATQLSYVTA